MSVKRYTMPKNWPIERKVHKFIVKTSPGPHAKKASIPLGLFLRDIMKFAMNMKEARQILNKKLVKVDNIVRKDRRFPVGIMDVISVGDDHFHILPKKNGFDFKKTKNNNTKLLKIKDKTTLKKNKTQLNFYNGCNLLVDNNDYKPGDTLVIDIDNNSIKQHLKMQEGSFVIIIEGKNVGTTGKIKKPIETPGSQKSIMIIESNDKDIVVPKNYLYVIGEDKPLIGADV